MALCVVPGWLPVDYVVVIPGVGAGTIPCRLAEYPRRKILLK